MPRPPSPTIKDVAARARVSVATVTNVLHGRCGRFSGETEEAVRRAIVQLGYRPNEVARTLVRRRSDTLAVVLDHLGESLMQNPYFSMLFDGFLFAAIERGYQVKTVALPGRDMDSIRRHTEDGSVDGAMLAAPKVASPLLDWVECCSLPCVVAGMIPASARVSCADVDDEGAVHEAVRWLVSLGHRRIGLIGGPPDYWSARQREVGYRRALRDSGIDPPASWLGRGDFSTESGRRAVLPLMAVRPALTAVLCCNDWMALGALEALRRQGIRVPDDLSIVGFDDAEAAHVAHPPLTTIRQPVREIGARAADILIRQVEQGCGAPERVVFPGVLVRRESAARPGAR
ncbi:MAG: LacI family DNA-binding transcriptional regulator [Chthonomonadales bacterium]|nr:LacI family DNA-binding transcriptional regulator [Chthonomonadales bacterium]